MIKESKWIHVLLFENIPDDIPLYVVKGPKDIGHRILYKGKRDPVSLVKALVKAKKKYEWARIHTKDDELIMS